MPSYPRDKDPMAYSDHDYDELEAIRYASKLMKRRLHEYFEKCGLRWGCDWAEAGAWLNNPVGPRPGKKTGR